MTYATQKLREVFTIKKGRKPELHFVKKQGDIPYLVAKVMRGSQEPEWVRRDDPNAVHVAEHEAIIICDGSNSGEVFSGFSGALSSTMAKIEPKVPIDQAYLRRFLESNAELFAGTKTGTAIPHLDQDAMFNLEIPLPPLPEQQRIARLLGEAFEGIDVARTNSAKNLQNAREIFERQMQSVFTQSLSALHGVDGAQGSFMSKPWQTYSLGELTARKPISYGVLKPGPRQEFGVPLIRITDIKNNYLDETNLYHITQSLSQEFKRTILQGGEVLLSIQGTIGRVAICPRHLSGANISRTIALIAPDERVNREFLRYWLLSAQDQFPVGGATRDSLNIGDIRNLQCPAPPLAEQHRIVRLLQELESSSQNLSVVYAKKLSALNNLSNSFLDQAFSGNLKTA
jgi:type I restriction enzyme S subunit